MESMNEVQDNETDSKAWKTRQISDIEAFTLVFTFIFAS